MQLFAIARIVLEIQQTHHLVGLGHDVGIRDVDRFRTHDFLHQWVFDVYDELGLLTVIDDATRDDKVCAQSLPRVGSGADLLNSDLFRRHDDDQRPSNLLHTRQLADHDFSQTIRERLTPRGGANVSKWQYCKPFFGRERSSTGLIAENDPAAPQHQQKYNYCRNREFLRKAMRTNGEFFRSNQPKHHAV